MAFGLGVVVHVAVCALQVAVAHVLGVLHVRCRQRTSHSSSPLQNAPPAPISHVSGKFVTSSPQVGQAYKQPAGTP